MWNDWFAILDRWTFSLDRPSPDGGDVPAVYGVLHSRQIFSPSKTGFTVFVRRLLNFTLMTLVQASSKGSRRPIQAGPAKTLKTSQYRCAALIFSTSDLKF